MPVLVGPLFSLEARGTIAGILTYSRSKGMDMVRANLHHMDANTVNQQTIRSYFLNATDAWAALTSGNKTSWDTWASNQGNPAVSGYNAFIGKYVLYLIDHTGVEPTAPFLPPS